MRPYELSDPIHPSNNLLHQHVSAEFITICISSAIRFCTRNNYPATALHVHIIKKLLNIEFRTQLTPLLSDATAWFYNSLLDITALQVQQMGMYQQGMEYWDDYRWGQWQGQLMQQGKWDLENWGDW